MKTLIIPDVHQDIRGVQRIFELEDKDSFDEIIFLGDWFDSFWDPPRVASFEDTCLFVRDLVWNNKGKMTFLVGNHDLAYIYNNRNYGYARSNKATTYFCSGVTGNKISTFRQIFFDRGLKDEWFLENFKIAHKSNGWIFSHAGLINRQIPYGHTIDQVINEIIPDVWRNFRNTEYANNYLLSAVGMARSGLDSFGGVLWLDFNTEFFASPDIGKQVFGHTHCSEPTAIALNTDYESWNLDTNLRDYAIIRDGKLTTYKVK